MPTRRGRVPRLLTPPLAAALLCVLAHTPVLADTAPRSAAYRIMPAGDSITQGARGDYTWRYHLWRHLAPEEPRVDFVGPYRKVADTSAGSEKHEVSPESDSGYRDPDFDQDHNAIWGRTLADARTTIRRDVREHSPDLILVLLGINDLVQPDASPERVEEELRAYLTDARAARPGVGFALARLTPSLMGEEDPRFARDFAEVNRRIGTVARDMATVSSPIAVVDIAAATGYTARRDTSDGTHPNRQGQVKIAAAFAETLAEEFSLGGRYPRPFTVTDSGGGEGGSATPGWPLTLGVAASVVALAGVLALRRHRMERRS
ncbi:lysophospholipase L1-like esterase [Haloactinospora alba]|uniref:Lysophospholipase L1-like esterase n=1 Tax=Haloactinospora alba TaxID=405555 RepID=A0A543NM29_9ACTN|nr:GDSL-type esterase/lipase family protein [Haloactinospora alba]TQN32886.1 lysophospholipase L1-like esterase [Haloactinospora alba]